ncbi:MAG: aminoacetone oxidase family FAD-binding enzyme, partial [Abditibacteriota bacterium]|nr:aminoacetone oxidase family FAD-binding enzyme [Abditibacteriota bacterium]
GARVLAPEISDSAIAGVRVFGGVMPADSVIIATGGLSYPGTGSTGDGYGFARAAGHTVTPLGPSLCGMITDEKWPAALSGLSLKNVKCTLARPGGKALASETGEMLFTHKGVSGPIILTLSKTAAEAGGPLVLVIDLKPYIPAEELENSFRQAFCGKGLLKGYMEKRLPKAMVPALPVIKEACGLPLSGITAKQRKQLVSARKNGNLSKKSLCPIEEAIITKGGVSTAEVDPKTMASRIVRGLYFCGEILDIDAVTGGYNLQAAFSTGYVAGINAALSKEEEKR